MLIMNKPSDNDVTRHVFLPFAEPRKDQSETQAAPTGSANWFQDLTPLLDEAASATLKSPRQARPVIPPSAKAVSFPSIQQIQDEERLAQMLGTPEPPELIRMREEAQETARQLVVDAYNEAQRIEDEARESGRQAGYAMGFSQGEQAGKQAAEARATAARTVLHEDIAAFVAHVEALRQQAWNEMEPQVMQLVFDLARHVIKQEVESNRSVVMAVIRNALRRVADSGTLRIRVSEADLETVRGSREELIGLLENIHQIEIVEDRRVGPGGCVVETERGNIDARIETQVGEIGAALQRILNPQEPDQRAA